MGSTSRQRRSAHRRTQCPSGNSPFFICSNNLRFSSIDLLRANNDNPNSSVILFSNNENSSSGTSVAHGRRSPKMSNETYELIIGAHRWKNKDAKWRRPPWPNQKRLHWGLLGGGERQINPIIFFSALGRGLLAHAPEAIPGMSPTPFTEGTVLARLRDAAAVFPDLRQALAVDVRLAVLDQMHGPLRGGDASIVRGCLGFCCLLACLLAAYMWTLLACFYQRRMAFGISPNGTLALLHCACHGSIL